MNVFKTIVALAALAGLGGTTQAGLFGSHLGCGASKCCDCADTCAPACRPTIARPCHVNVYNYQRSCAKPFNCCDGCDLGSCCPANNCAPGYAGNACAPACAPVCAAPCGDACLANGCIGNGCVAACDAGCGAPCDVACDDCCPAVDACELAELIYVSQTACYARQRRRALQILGARYSCVCNPEIMSAFIYALNDADESVRANAADEIGDQLRKYCCCSPCVTSALTYALADCDWRVRRQAEEALRLCGYDIVDGCCDVACCDTGCLGGNCAPGGIGAPVEMNPEAAPIEGGAPLAPAPAPPAEVGPPAAPVPAAEYFPRTMPEQTVRKSNLKNSLRNLFTLSN